MGIGLSQVSLVYIYIYTHVNINIFNDKTVVYAAGSRPGAVEERQQV